MFDTVVSGAYESTYTIWQVADNTVGRTGHVAEVEVLLCCNIVCLGLCHGCVCSLKSVLGRLQFV